MRGDRVRPVRIGKDRYLSPDDLAAMQSVTQADGVIPAWHQNPQHGGMRLRWLREAAGLTQIALGAKAGLTHEVLSLIETGKRAPRPETLRRLAHALRVEPERFIRDAPLGLSMMTVAEAARRLDVPPPRVQLWLKQGHLEGVKVSGEWRVATIVVDALARSGRLRGRSNRLDPRYRG